MTELATTLEVFRDHLNITSDDDNVELAAHIAAATQVAESDPEVGIGAIVNRDVTVNVTLSGGLVIVPVGPIVDVTAVGSLDGSVVVDVADLDVDHEAGVIRGVDGSPGRYSITYTAGRAATTADVPEDIQLAVCIIGRHLWETQRGNAPSRSALPGSDAELPAAANYLVPFRAAAILRSYPSWVSIA